jgi:hypothetical protein
MMLLQDNSLKSGFWADAVSQVVNTILSNSEVQTPWIGRKKVTIFFK